MRSCAGRKKQKKTKNEKLISGMRKVCDTLFAFSQSSLSQNLWLVTTVCHTDIHSGDLADDLSDDNDGGDTMWSFGVWNKSVFHPPHCQVRLMENTNFASLQSLLLSPGFWSFALRSATQFGPMRFAVAVACPIWCVYDSFVHSLVHIRAYCGQGDSFSAGLGSGFGVILVQWFITFLSK